MEKRQQRRRIPVTLAGSPLARGFHKLPQAPPNNPVSPEQKVEPTACPHGVKLTQQDFEQYERVYGGRIFDGSQVLLDTSSYEVLSDGSKVGPHAFEAKACPECFPTCSHGEQLTAEEITAAWESGKKLSSDCPACTCSTDPKEWDRFLKDIGFSQYRGMQPAGLYLPTREGGVHALGQRKTLVTGGYDEKKLDEVAGHEKANEDGHNQRGEFVPGSGGLRVGVFGKQKSIDLIFNVGKGPDLETKEWEEETKKE